MTPQELSARHPCLYHVTAAANEASLRRDGLLTTADLLERFEVEPGQREQLMTDRRKDSVRLSHPVQGEAFLGDNVPLSMKALAGCLEDDLSPADWLRMLNSRVFFFVREKDAQKLAGARNKADLRPVILKFDTLGLVSAYHTKAQIAAINTGAAVRRPPSRGRSTFTPLDAVVFKDWQGARGKKGDQIKEVVVTTSIPDAAAYLKGAA